MCSVLRIHSLCFFPKHDMNNVFPDQPLATLLVAN